MSDGPATPGSSNLTDEQSDWLFERTGIRYRTIQDGTAGIGVTRRDRRKWARMQARQQRKEPDGTTHHRSP